MLSLASVLLHGQTVWSGPFESLYGIPARWPSAPGFLLDAPAHSIGAPWSYTVSIDILRHPISNKARQIVEQALHLADLGKHAAAIEALRYALVKQPAAAPYIQSALGVEYINTRQFTSALTSFAAAVESFPHESAAHSNFGLSLAATGQLDRAEKELRKALELERTNAKAQAILEAVLVLKRAAGHHSEPAAP